MNDIAEGAVGVAMVGIGQAVTDEAVEALAAKYGVGKGIIVHLLIEAGIPVAAGVAVQYATDNPQAKNMAIGMIAAGAVNGARIGVQKLKMWWENRQSGSGSGDGSDGQMQGVNFSLAQRRLLAQRLAAQQRNEARQLPDRRPQPERPRRKSSGKLASNTAGGGMVRR